MVTVNTVHDGCFHGQRQMDDAEWFRDGSKKKKKRMVPRKKRMMVRNTFSECGSWLKNRVSNECCHLLRDVTYLAIRQHLLTYQHHQHL